MRTRSAEYPSYIVLLLLRLIISWILINVTVNTWRDTTFNLGDFYLSVLLFRVTCFESSPTVLLAYHIHERKLAETHDEFFRHVANTIPDLRTTSNTIIVTDGETAIRQAIDKHLPAVKSFLCW